MDRKQPRTISSHLSWRNWPIRVKLLAVMLVVSLLPLLIAMWLSLTSSANALNQQTRISLSRLAYSTAQRIEQFLVDNHNFIRMAASDARVIEFLSTPIPEERTKLKGGVENVVANLLSSDPALDLVGFYDKKGIVILHNNPAIIGQNYLFRDYVQSALTGQQFTSDIQVGWTTDTPGINASAPVTNGSQIVGAIATRIQGKFVTEILKSTLNVESKDISQREREAIEIFLVNGYGIVLSQSEESEWLYRSLGAIQSTEVISAIASVRSLGGTCPGNAPQCDANLKTPRLPQPIPAAQPLADKLSQAIQIGESGGWRYCRPKRVDDPFDGQTCAGDWHVVGYAPVRDPFRVNPATNAPANLFMVVVDMPENVFMQPIEQQRAQGILIAVAMAILALLASLTLARTVAQPIGRLAAVARDVENDQPFDPQDVADLTAHTDEVSNLARVFSDMVVALRARMAELRTIYEIGHTISSSVELRQTLIYIVRSLSGIISYDVAEICLYDQEQDKMVVHVATGSGPDATIFTIQRAYDARAGYIGRLVETGAGLLIPDTQALPLPDVERTWQRDQARSYLGVPLKDQNAVIGAIELVSRQPDGFSQDNLRILESIAIQAAVAVRNAQEVQLRERKLKQQIQELRIEIDEFKRQKQVAEIVETDYFQRLRQKAQAIRDRGKGET